MEKDQKGKLAQFQVLAARAGLDWFLVGIILVILWAYLWREPGIYEGTFSLSQVAHYGVSVIFFFYGLKLSPQQLKAGLSRWKLHIVIQSSTFLLFPLIVLPFYPLFKGTQNEALWLGVFYLAALPSTVSSSVVMVSIAGGNMVAAIFNASVSSLLGIFITPLWMGIFLSANPHDFDIWHVLGNLMLQVLLPVMLGLLLQKFLGAFVNKNKQRLKIFDQVIILLIIYTSFSESFAREMFKGIATIDLLMLGVIMIGFFFLVYGIMHFISYMMGFDRSDRISVLFCGSKKSLVHGTVMSKVLFPDANLVGIILLPIMIYHALQLLLVSSIAQSMARKVNTEIK